MSTQGSFELVWAGLKQGKRRILAALGVQRQSSLYTVILAVPWNLFWAVDRPKVDLFVAEIERQSN